jgi:hypothetical protein
MVQVDAEMPSDKQHRCQSLSTACLGTARLGSEEPALTLKSRRISIRLEAVPLVRTLACEI